MKIQLTISLLVSDRIDTLGRCLSSLKPLLRELDSELIIVYTGKNQDTLELARQYTPHIIPFEWCNDFSKARNAGLMEAKGEWFLYLDDDEWFEDTEEIIQFFKSGEYRKYQSAEYIQRNYLDWEASSHADAYVGRMCRRQKETRFVYPIHENIRPFLGPCKKFDVYVHHFGYIRENNEEEQNLKSDRNLSLLLERLEKEPPSAHLYAQMAQEYASIRKYDDAIRYCREGLVLAKKEDGWDSLELWLQFELPHLILCSGDLTAALAEGEKILASPRLAEVGELNIAALLVDICLSMKEYEKGIKYVRRYRKILEYLWKHPEKAMSQNGITVTFSGAEIQAAAIYAKGLVFSSELGEMGTVEEILSWMPWDDAVRMPSQYMNLEEWKRQYKEQKKSILSAYYGLESDNAYVTLQKAYYAEGRNRVKEAAEFWEKCAQNCPPGFEEQLLRMAVRNRFSLEKMLDTMSLEKWDECAKIVSEHVPIPELTGFYQNILPELAGRPLFAERLHQCFLEKQLTRGMMETSRLVELFSEYCESVISDAGMIYREDILENQDSYILPLKYRFAVMVKETLQFIEAGRFVECVPLLMKALHVYPQMSAAISHLTGYLNERIVNPPNPSSEEFSALGGQVKQMLLVLMNNKQWNDAYGVITKLMSLVPDDMEILRLKQEIISQLRTGYF